MWQAAGLNRRLHYLVLSVQITLKTNTDQNEYALALRNLTLRCDLSHLRERTSRGLSQYLLLCRVRTFSEIVETRWRGRLLATDIRTYAFFYLITR